MMKKIITLLLMFVMCGSAFATLAIQPVVGGQTEITVNPSDIFYVDLVWLNDVYGPPGELSAADMQIVIDGPASIVDIAELTLNADYVGSAGELNYAGLDGLFSVTSWNAGAAPGEIIIDHIGIHCDGPGDVRITVTIGNSVQGISLVDWNDPLDTDNGGPGLDVATLLVHQTPEPMTIALLGLGGLFLRRKK